jgi:hypothetical protein
MTDNKTIRTMVTRTRVSVEKSARGAGIKNIKHKSRLQLARDIDRARKDARNARARDIMDGTKFAKRPEDRRTGKFNPSVFRNHMRLLNAWDTARLLP